MYNNDYRYVIFWIMKYFKHFIFIQFDYNEIYASREITISLACKVFIYIFIISVFLKNALEKMH